MKLVTYSTGHEERLGLYSGQTVYDLSRNAALLTQQTLPAEMNAFLREGDGAMQVARALDEEIRKQNSRLEAVPSGAGLLAPVPHPTSCRDGYAFRQHVIAEFDQYPIFYFTNHNAVQGPGDIFCMPDHFQKLDFELEAAVVIGRRGRNVRAADADAYIAGYMIMNDMSARTLQMEEMLLNLGPAKGKDFSTVIGPWLVTPDELEPYRIPAKENHTGNRYNLVMTCSVNGKEVSRGNMGDMDWTFAEIIERCAYGADILPGDVIGSGTVGTGCFLELNGTGLLHDPAYRPQWLQEGDVVEMEITGLGVLRNTIRKEASDFSLLALKKK
jgi:fumarylacetoacetate (FAA) hydrolase